MSTEMVKVQASQIATTIKTLLQEDGEDEDEGAGDEDEGEQKTSRWPNAQAVGIILSRLRLPKDRESTHGRGRHRLISQKEVFQLAIAHHLVHLTNNMSNPSDLVHMSDEKSPGGCGDGPPSPRAGTNEDASLAPSNGPHASEAPDFDEGMI
jgi:hypothetical protein